MRRNTVRYGRSPQVDHDMGTDSPLPGFSRPNIAQLNARTHTLLHGLRLLFT
jgi:hypothetical protein